jgi:hypothetical protein
MFSTTPRIGAFSLRNNATDLPAIDAATACGVITITTPVSGTSCAVVIGASPVPGGKSTSK